LRNQKQAGWSTEVVEKVVEEEEVSGSEEEALGDVV